MAAFVLFLADLPGLVLVEGVLTTDDPHCILLTDGGKELLAFREAWHVARRCLPLQGYLGCRVRVIGVIGTFGSGSDTRQTISVWHIGPADARKQVELAHPKGAHFAALQVDDGRMPWGHVPMREEASAPNRGRPALNGPGEHHQPFTTGRTTNATPTATTA